MSPILVSAKNIEDRYEVLSGIGNLGPRPGDGFLRAAYSAEESEAMRYMEREGRAIGMTSRYDAIGNLALEYLPPGRAGVVEMGSHLDTVPFGGNYDGAAGVVAGLEAIRAVLDSGLEIGKGLRLRVWRGEESATYNSVYTGSLGAFGKLNPANLDNAFRGMTLRDAILAQGYDPQLIASGVPAIQQAEIDDIVAHLELHIEQGNVLEVEGKEIGIVTSIRGPKRYRVVLEGQFDHSGATPMGVDYRRDVNLAIAYIMVRLDELAGRHLAQGRDLVQTVGVINSDEALNSRSADLRKNAATKVSGYGYFTLDVRSADNAFRASYTREVEDLIRSTASEFRVSPTIVVTGESAGIAELDPAIARVLQSACEGSALSFRHLPSGAGHDAAIVGQQSRSDGSKVPVGMVFIPCLEGKSHCPEEFASAEAIAKGAMVLANSIYALAR